MVPDLSHGVPHADTYRRVFERVNPEALQRCFLGWVSQVVKQAGAQVIPIDGKCMKGSYDRKKKQSALHVVSACSIGPVSQVKVEIRPTRLRPSLSTGIARHYRLRHTIDAMGTQRDCDPDCGQRRRLYFEPQSQSSDLIG